MFEVVDGSRKEEYSHLLGSESDVKLQLKKSRKIIIARGKRAQFERAARAVVHFLYQSAFIQLILLIWLNIAQVVKFFIPFVSIILEAVNLVASVINLIHKEKPWYLILCVIAGSLASIAIMGLIDAFRFGSTVPFVVSAFAAGPAVFTAVLGMFSVLRFSKVIFVDLIPYIKDSSARLPLKAFSLVNGFVKGAALAALAGLMIPFFGALVLNPYGAMVFAGAIVAVVGVIIVMKIVKTIVENVVWRQTIKEFTEKNEDPYELLGLVDKHTLNPVTGKVVKIINRSLLDQKLDVEESLRKADKSLYEQIKARVDDFTKRIKHIWYDSPLSTLFARTKKQKKALEDAREAMKDDKDGRVSSFIKECYLDAFYAAAGDTAKQLLIKKAYDLFRKDRGMKLWAERALRAINIDEESDSDFSVGHRGEGPQQGSKQAESQYVVQPYDSGTGAPASNGNQLSSEPTWANRDRGDLGGVVVLKTNIYFQQGVRPIPIPVVHDQEEQVVVRHTRSVAAAA